MLNEYPQEFVDSTMKPLRSNCPSDTIYQGTVIIPYVKGISISVSGPFSKLNIHSMGH
jgi:hypothetical protein